MNITSADIRYLLSGGSLNSSSSLSLGGARSGTSAGINIFDEVKPAEALVGSVEYRCIYVFNANLTESISMISWIQSNTPSGDTALAIGLGASSMGGVESAVPEGAAPADIIFTAAANKASGLVLGTLGPRQSRAIWLRRTVTPGAVPIASDSFVIRTEETEEV